ncbi:hypothetical protein QR680_006364 [Steinernema hermaphroditum]|uniref:eIF-4F 25 kDa subunit n=1 Tax=Steinernema hermaphroditum TaxID=289476 RepID=A0AA39HWQ3_9BILA|nr:hypothetical protein QR680_006364 [Steinernema hermaphroditum]
MIPAILLVLFLFVFLFGFRFRKQADRARSEHATSDDVKANAHQQEKTDLFDANMPIISDLLSNNGDVCCVEHEQEKPSDLSLMFLANARVMDFTSPRSRHCGRNRDNRRRSSSFSVKRAKPTGHRSSKTSSCRWVFWRLMGSEKMTELEWKAALRRVGDVSNISDFWQIYGHHPRPSDLPCGHDYNLFKEGIVPMWEDASNAKGGRWLIYIPKSRRTDVLDRWWRKLASAVMGKPFADCIEHICGVVVKITVWTRDADNKEVNMHIARIIKKTLDIPVHKTLFYIAHNFPGPTSRPELMYTL